MLHLTKTIHMATPVKNSPLNLSTKFIMFPIRSYGFFIFIHDCIESQTNKSFLLNLIRVPLLYQFFEEIYRNLRNYHFNYRILLDTKGLISPVSQKNSYLSVTIYAFSDFVVLNLHLILFPNMPFKQYSVTG